VSDREAFVRRFHAAHPGITGRALARANSYARLAALVRADARVLDLACGDGVLLAQLGPHAIGLDLSREELGAVPRVVQGRAQALPFADGSFDAVTCHLAFMLFDDVERVVAELHRVLVPGGMFAALLGGGPTATGDDAFHRFLAILAPHLRDAVRLGDPRTRSEAGWRDLFAGWSEPTFTRCELDLGGTFEDVWAFVGASYELPSPVAGEVRVQLEEATVGMIDPTGRIPCRAVTWLAQLHRPG
jgi:SAM-dependent methyltransferase